MYELKNGKVFTSKSVWTGPSSYEKKNLPGCSLTKVEKHCSKGTTILNAVFEQSRGCYKRRVFSQNSDFPSLSLAFSKSQCPRNASEKMSRRKNTQGNIPVLTAE